MKNNKIISKPSQEEINNLFRNNTKMFNDSADYWFRKNRKFYDAYYKPLTLQIKVVCPHCHKEVSPLRKSGISGTGAVIFFTFLLFVILFYFLTIKSKIFIAFEIIAAIIAFLGFAMRKYYSICPACRKKLESRIFT